MNMGVFVHSVAGCGDLAVAFTVERDFTVFYDASGALLRQIRQARFTGTITAVGSGRSVPYEGRFTQVYDYRAGTRSVSGDMLRATLPDGRVVFAAGHEVDAGPTDLLFETPHASNDAFFAQVCQGLQ
jgi:hypothetical protein